MPRQATFTIIPNPMGMQGLVNRQNGESPIRPPMTSKQAQKIFKQSTRLPKLSKAEQRRLEREEQERIRKDLEKEKQAARARLARDRRKAKDQLVLEEKKRKGLPIVDVRPSQDTISRFARGVGRGRKRNLDGKEIPLQAIAEDLETDLAVDALSDREDDNPENGNTRQNPIDASASYAGPSKRLREDFEDRTTSQSVTAYAVEEDTSEVRSRNLKHDDDDPAIENMLQSQLLSEAHAAATVPLTDLESDDKPHPVRTICSDVSDKSEQPAETSPLAVVEVTGQITPFQQMCEVRPDGIQHDPFQDPLPDQSPHAALFAKLGPAQTFQSPLRSTQQNAPDPHHPVMEPSSAATRFAVPPLPPKKNSTKPKCLPPQLCTPVSRSRHGTIDPAGGLHVPGVRFEPKLPTSTQMFVLSHVEDLFPTPSQEIIELKGAEVSLAPLPTGSEVTAAIVSSVRLGSKPYHPLPVRQPVAGSSSPVGLQRDLGIMALPLISTQDLLLSSQDIRDFLRTPGTPRRACAKTSPVDKLRQSKASQQVEKSLSTSERPTCREQQGSPPRTRKVARMTPRIEQGATSRKEIRLSSHVDIQEGHHCNNNTAHTTGSDRFKVRKSPCKPLAAAPELPPCPSIPWGNLNESISVERRCQARTPCSPPKKRFFTASNNEGVYFAMEQSRRVYREEQRAREAEHREQERRFNEDLECMVHQLLDEGELSGEEHEGLEEGGIGKSGLIMPDPQKFSANEQIEDQDCCLPRHVLASQETDYGDFSCWDAVDVNTQVEDADNELDELLGRDDLWADDLI